MERFFLSVCVFISIAACNSVPSNSFKLEGFVEGAEDSESIILYYSLLKNDEWHEIADTAKIINGKFSFEGNIDELTAAVLCFDNCHVVIDARIYLEPTAMKIKINKNHPYAYELSGTKVEKENIELRKALGSDEKSFYEGLSRMDDILKQMELNVKHDNNIPVLDSLINRFLDEKQHLAPFDVKINKARRNFILRHNAYRIAPDLLYLTAVADMLPVDTLKAIYDNLPERSKTSLMGKRAWKEIESIENKKNASEEEAEDVDPFIGRPAPDFTRKDFSGNTIHLSDFKKKNFILLDFWASWCAPCIREIPAIKNVYDQYCEKGFTIISISCDKDRNSWLSAINKYHLEVWPQILSEEDKNNCDANIDDLFSMYNVQSIPHLILIDKQGKMISRWKHLGEKQLIEIDNLLKNN